MPRLCAKLCKYYLCYGICLFTVFFNLAPKKLISLDFFLRCMGITGTPIQVAACVLLLGGIREFPGVGDSMFSTPHLSKIASRFGSMKKTGSLLNSFLLKSFVWTKMTWDQTPNDTDPIEEAEANPFGPWTKNPMAPRLNPWGVSNLLHGLYSEEFSSQVRQGMEKTPPGESKIFFVEQIWVCCCLQMMPWGFCMHLLWHQRNVCFAI